ncbi:hypothetical protein BHM03_00029560 [Ensete ventricosum]|nr:hypothetical protein BHM03_00029560 [Ensete ventricosum]
MFSQRENFQMEGPTGVMKQLQTLWKILELIDGEMFGHLTAIGAESLHFAFRMLLVLFRRELSFDEALRMWEVLMRTFEILFLTSYKGIMFLCWKQLIKQTSLVSRLHSLGYSLTNIYYFQQICTDSSDLTNYFKALKVEAAILLAKSGA